MKTKTTFLILLSLLWIQTSKCLAASSNEALLKLDSILVSGFTKYQYSYNEQGQLISERFFIVTEDSINMIYNLSTLTEHFYENGKKTSSVVSRPREGVITPFTRTVYEYDGEKLSVEKQENFVNNQWITDKKSTCFYNEDGLLSNIEYSVFRNDVFLLIEQDVYQYDEQSNELSCILKQMLIPENQWSDKSKTEFTYESGNLVCQIDYNYNDTINDWRATLKKEYIYNASDDNKVIYREYYFVEDAFVLALETEITLDSTCPSENLILPFENNLPYKVENEYNSQSQKVSNYYYSPLETSGVISLDGTVHTSIYPNPAKDILNIRSNQCINAVDIFDVSGRLSAVHSGPATQLDISALTQGIYYVKISSAGQCTTLKLIKR